MDGLFDVPAPFLQLPSFILKLPFLFHFPLPRNLTASTMLYLKTEGIS